MNTPLSRWFHALLGAGLLVLPVVSLACGGPNFTATLTADSGGSHADAGTDVDYTPIIVYFDDAGAAHDAVGDVIQDSPAMSRSPDARTDATVADAAASGDATVADSRADAATDSSADAIDACPTNACGGCGTLAGPPSGSCGCGGLYMFVCSTDKSSVTCNDPGANACGGCGTLAAAPASPCGKCGAYACSPNKGSVVCNDPGLNLCGGCGTLPAAPSTACGKCGTYVCSTDKTSVACSDPGQNACGGCGTLAAAPGTTCGACGNYTCSGDKSSVVCMGSSSTHQCSGNGTVSCGADGQWAAAITPCPDATPTCQGGSCGSPPSCAAVGSGRTSCGPAGESCCTSPAVTGGTYYRFYDGITSTDTSHPATVSGYRLDKYDVTVGRFRQFVNAVVNTGWLPPGGSGKHAHLNGGKGLADSSVPATYESGWSAVNNGSLYTTAGDWNTNLSCDPAATWTPAAGANENRPINCLNWASALAFCIWDGAFLPSEAEWNYAASGGSEQRVYPWSSPAASQAIDCSYSNYSPPSGACVAPPYGATNDVGSEAPKGNSKWGQADLGGNVWEMVLDSYAPLVTPCVDCAYLGSGGLLLDGWPYANAGTSSSRGTNPGYSTLNGAYLGMRCARSP